MSLAGAQDKLVVCLVDGQIALAEDGRPTTHILKLFIEGLDGSVENELFCMQLAKRIGLDVSETSKGSTGATDYLLVKRYDRILRDNGTILRIHQEDFCQALSVPPELKYEEEGGPSIARSQQLIHERTMRPAAERRSFLRMLIFIIWLVMRMLMPKTMHCSIAKTCLIWHRFMMLSAPPPTPTLPRTWP